VRNIHRYWVEQRRLQISRGDRPRLIGRSEPEPLRRAPKIGRNDPCPRLGQEIQRCHGRAEVPRTPRAKLRPRLDASWTCVEAERDRFSRR
jgi:hypothetical protein